MAEARATRIAVVGATGFIGSQIIACSEALGITSSSVVMPRVDGLTPPSISQAVDQWCRMQPVAFEQLRSDLSFFDIVINAAGTSNPGSKDMRRLFSSNAVLPAIVARAAFLAGVRRFLHVSSAAVQGRLVPLDETLRQSPLSPYAQMKAAAERYLLQPDHDQNFTPSEVTIYRPASVFGVGHHATRVLSQLVTRFPIVPVVGKGDQPLPVALVDNVAAGILFAATMPAVAEIVAQPSENISTRSLLMFFGARRTVHLPPKPVQVAVSALAHRDPGRPAVTARLRWFELLLLGQPIQAEALAFAGFVPPAGGDAWLELGQRARDDRESVRPSVLRHGGSCTLSRSLMREVIQGLRRS